MNIIKSVYFVSLLFIVISVSSPVTSCRGREKTQAVEKTEPVLKLEKTISLSGVTGRIDHVAIDVKNQVLFIAALGNNSVEAVDLIKGERTNTVKDIEEPQGIVFIPGNNTICVSSGGSGDCNFYNAKTFSLLSSIKLGSDADNMRFDPKSNLIFTGYGEGGIAVIDALKQIIISKITFSGHPEAFQPEKNGSRIYINVPSEKSIVIADYKSNSVTDNLHIESAASNFPISMDENNHRLFTGCRKPSELIVFDTENRKEVTRFEIRGDADDIFYDSEKKFLFVSCGEGYLQVYKQDDKDTYNLIQEISTSKGARTSLFVPELERIYLAVPQNGNSEASIQVYKITK